MSSDQQLLTDRAVKQTLIRMDDISRNLFDLQPLNGKTFNRPPEQSAKMVAQWNQMEKDNRKYMVQLLDEGQDDYYDLQDYNDTDDSVTDDSD